MIQKLPKCVETSNFGIIKCFTQLYSKHLLHKSVCNWLNKMQGGENKCYASGTLHSSRLAESKAVDIWNLLS
jgi:hypothetical protein